MDPELWELYESGAPEDEVSVIVRLVKDTEPPPSLRIVCRFGDIATARVSRGDIVAVRQSPAVFSLKGSGAVTLPRTGPAAEGDQAEGAEGPAPMGASLSAVPGDGRGVVVGICDWGFDFTHANFRNEDGTTRLQALWDQRGFGDPLAPAPYDQGRLLTRSAINAALAEADPCAALGYHPASGDPSDTGSHGTHVADILAGNRREPGSEVGLASGADLVFVHLGAQKLGEIDNLGDSVGLLEGLDFCRRQAAGRPCVLHLSAGKTGGPHMGNTLLERAVDFMLQEPGIVLVQSVGNYADSAMHTHARVGPDQQHSIDWLIPEGDRTPNELEIWYSGEDVFEARLIAPGGQEFAVALDGRMRLQDGGGVWGNFYHRLHEPNSGLNHINIFLYTAAPAGRWRVALRGRDVVDGRLHAWIERDLGGRNQSRFPRSQASSRYTTNTICNCFRAIAVGAYDATSPGRTPTRFSSRGPTADGRQKPELAAPGYRIRAARSVPRNGWRGERRLCVKSGTSMAAPWVSGTVALMLAAAGRPLTIHEVRRALIGSADPHDGPSGRSSTRLGYGYLNVAAAVEAARLIGRQDPGARAPIPLPLEEPEPEAEAEGEDCPSAWVEDAGADAAADGLAVPETEAEVDPGEDEGEDEDLDDEADPMAPFEASEALQPPLAWEDVRDALEALDDRDS